jgi:hypothetical protein
MSNKVFNVLSLGAGVQSSTLALLYNIGIIKPKPDVAVFADTQAEPQAVYDYLEWIKQEVDFPIHQITKGKLADEALKIRTSKVTGKKYIRQQIPFFLFKNKVKKGFLPKGCTTEFKILPIRSFLRKHFKIPNKEKNVRIIMSLGISTDEITRMKDSRVDWIEHKYPLIEQNMSRSDCLKFIEDQGYPQPPKSACIFCPYHSVSYWKKMHKETPEEFNLALEYEKKAKEVYRNTDEYADPMYEISIHQHNKLDQTNQDDLDQRDLFDQDCEGMCGL